MKQKLPTKVVRKLKDDEKLDLPVPRLEIRKYVYDKPVDGYTVRADYNLVYEHLMGDHISVRLGQTRIGATLGRYDMFDLPFRDGAHLINEMVFMKMRGFVVFGDQYKEIFATSDMLPNATVEKLKKLSEES